MKIEDVRVGNNYKLEWWRGRFQPVIKCIGTDQHTGSVYCEVISPAMGYLMGDKCAVSASLLIELCEPIEILKGML